MILLLLDLFVQFAILNVIAFGGITALLPELHRLVVEQRMWMDSTTFAHLFAIAQSAPGPNLLVVSLIGWKVAGIPGAIVATLAISLPMSVFIYVFYRHWERFRTAPWRAAIQVGVAPLAVGLVCASGWLIAASAGLDYRGVELVVVCTVLMFYRRWHPLWYIAAGAAAGAAGLV